MNEFNRAEAIAEAYEKIKNNELRLKDVSQSNMHRETDEYVLYFNPYAGMFILRMNLECILDTNQNRTLLFYSTDEPDEALVPVHNGIGSIIVHPYKSEAEQFQRTLVEEDYPDVETMKQIQYIVEYIKSTHFGGVDAVQE